MSNVEDKGLEELMSDLDIEVEDKVQKDNILDLKTLGDVQLNNLLVFKSTRISMITKREALKRAIKIMDKRIEITLAAIKVLQTPT